MEGETVTETDADRAGGDFTVEEIRAALEDATDGPWMLWNGWGPSDGDGLMRVERIGPANTSLHGLMPTIRGREIAATRADLDLVANAPEYLDWLLSEIDRLMDAFRKAACFCGPVDNPDPTVHREDCAYRVTMERTEAKLEGEDD